MASRRCRNLRAFTTSLLNFQRHRQESRSASFGGRLASYTSRATALSCSGINPGQFAGVSTSCCSSPCSSCCSISCSSSLAYLKINRYSTVVFLGLPYHRFQSRLSAEDIGESPLFSRSLDSKGFKSSKQKQYDGLLT